MEAATIAGDDEARSDFGRVRKADPTCLFFFTKRRIPFIPSVKERCSDAPPPPSPAVRGKPIAPSASSSCFVSCSSGEAGVDEGAEE